MPTKWHTFYGGASSNDPSYGMALDASGNVYLTGVGTTTWNGPGPTSPVNAFTTGWEAIVLRINIIYLSAEAAALPETGFPQGVVTNLPAQPADLAYTDLGELWLEIPQLGVQMSIMGVPLGADGEWDVTWLGNFAGWLNGTAFPTWAGNTGITGHVWNASNNPGPFAELNELQFGDLVLIHAWGQMYTYEVRSNYLVNPENISPLRHEEYDWVTLLTCERYNESQAEYRYRRAVRAVLVDINSE